MYLDRCQKQCFTLHEYLQTTFNSAEQDDLPMFPAGFWAYTQLSASVIMLLLINRLKLYQVVWVLLTHVTDAQTNICRFNILAFLQQ